MMLRNSVFVLWVGSLFTAIGVGGCASPLEPAEHDWSRDRLVASYQAQLRAEATPTTLQLDQPADEAILDGLLPERRLELDRVSGPTAYVGETVNPGPDLTGAADADAQTVYLSLEQALNLALMHNIDTAIAYVRPMAAEAQRQRAEWGFDPVFFSRFDWTRSDRPSPSGPIPGLTGDQFQERTEFAIGVRRPLDTGGEVSVETLVRRQFEDPSVFDVNRYYDSEALLTLRQPLLRGFGRDVRRAEIRLTRNIEANEVEQLRQETMELAAEVEEAYWSLTFAQQRLLIQERLLERTVVDQERLRERAELDATRIRVTEASSFVQRRQAEVVRAQEAVHNASDRLKRLLNAPELPLIGETVILPSEQPQPVEITFNLEEAVSTGLQRRPELEIALLRIDDAIIRRKVAENTRLPMLDLIGQVGAAGIDLNRADAALPSLGSMDYPIYRVGVQFEIPLGNRAASAFARQRRFEQQEAALEYHRMAEDVVLEVKQSLRRVQTSHQLIGMTRAARRAAAESLSAIEAQEEAGVDLTPTFLVDMKFAAQQRLADAEVQEVEALTEYRMALARAYQAMGTLLEQGGIDVVLPDTAD